MLLVLHILSLDGHPQENASVFTSRLAARSSRGSVWASPPTTSRVWALASAHHPSVIAMAVSGGPADRKPSLPTRALRAMWPSNGLICPHTPQRTEHTLSATLPLTRAPRLAAREKGQEREAGSILNYIDYVLNSHDRSHVPDATLSTSQVTHDSPHNSTPAPPPPRKCYSWLHFSDGEPEARSGHTACPNASSTPIWASIQIQAVGLWSYLPRAYASVPVACRCPISELHRDLARQLSLRQARLGQKCPQYIPIPTARAPFETARSDG